MPSKPSARSAPAQHTSAYAANMQGVAAVDRAMSIALALEAAKAPMSLTEIADATGLYKSAVLRLMASLERCHLVRRRHDQAYVLGHFAFRLGKAYEVTSPIEEHLQPLMQALVEQGAESTSFHVRYDDAHRLCLLRIDSHHSTLDRIRAGDLLTMDAGAPAKVLNGVGTGADHDLLHVSFGERDPLCAAIAGPVFGPGGDLLGALSFSGPRERFTEETVKDMKPMLLHACIEATQRMGGRWPSARAAGSL